MKNKNQIKRKARDINSNDEENKHITDKNTLLKKIESEITKNISYIKPVSIKGNTVIIHKKGEGQEKDLIYIYEVNQEVDPYWENLPADQAIKTMQVIKANLLNIPINEVNQKFLTKKLGIEEGEINKENFNEIILTFLEIHYFYIFFINKNYLN